MNSELDNLAGLIRLTGLVGDTDAAEMAGTLLAAGYRKGAAVMTPDQASHLRDLFYEARKTTREADVLLTTEAYAADDAAVEAFNTALKEAMKR